MYNSLSTLAKRLIGLDDDTGDITCTPGMAIFSPTAKMFNRFLIRLTSVNGRPVAKMKCTPRASSYEMTRRVASEIVCLLFNNVPSMSHATSLNGLLPNGTRTPFTLRLMVVLTGNDDCIAAIATYKLHKKKIMIEKKKNKLIKYTLSI